MENIFNLTESSVMQLLSTHKEIASLKNSLLKNLYKDLEEKLSKNEYKRFLTLPTYQNKGRNVGQTIAHAIFSSYNSLYTAENIHHYRTSTYYSIPFEAIIDLRHNFTMKRVDLAFQSIAKDLDIDIFVKSKTEGGMVRLRIKPIQK